MLFSSRASLTESRPSLTTGTTGKPGRRWLPSADKIRGVNLGSMFISCVQRLGQDAADAAFQTHWQTWITADDLNEIKSYGLNTVRIPVGFWINEELVNDGEYYPKGGLEYLDYIVGNCTELGLYVIMDLHGGPGSQYPGQPYTGHVVDWPGFYTPDNYERAYKFLEWMTERVHTTPAYYNVGMLQVMNEPVHSNDYPSQAADMVANYYSNAWNRIREREAQLVTADSDKLHIQFMGDAWGSGNPNQNLPDTTFAFYDDHRYFKWDTATSATHDSYISAVCNYNGAGSDTIIGEWSMSILEAAQYNPEFDIRNTGANDDWYKEFFAAQAQAYERSGGWVFWSWKCNWIEGFNEWRWCYKSAADAGIIPKNAASAAGMSPC
ncbi:glycoside hydrolase superfamily [Hypoxylon argillaceum]|nr:glycoside hydrolase superfamily [Hypoxylon argillaceum]